MIYSQSLPSCKFLIIKSRNVSKRLKRGSSSIYFSNQDISFIKPIQAFSPRPSYDPNTNKHASPNQLFVSKYKSFKDNINALNSKRKPAVDFQLSLTASSKWMLGGDHSNLLTNLKSPLGINKLSTINTTDSYQRKDSSSFDRPFKHNFPSKLAEVSSHRKIRFQNLSTNMNNVTTSTHLKSKSQSIFSEKSLVTSHMLVKKKSIINNETKRNNKVKLEELLRVMEKYSKQKLKTSEQIIKTPRESPLIKLTKIDIDVVDKVNSQIKMTACLPFQLSTQDELEINKQSTPEEGAVKLNDELENINENSSDKTISKRSKLSSSNFLSFKPSFKKKKSNDEEYKSTVKFLKSLEDRELFKSTSKPSMNFNSPTKGKLNSISNSRLQSPNKSLVDSRYTSKEIIRRVRFMTAEVPKQKRCSDLIAPMRTVNKLMTYIRKKREEKETPICPSSFDFDNDQMIDSHKSRTLNKLHINNGQKGFITQKDKLLPPLEDFKINLYSAAIIPNSVNLLEDACLSSLAPKKESSNFNLKSILKINSETSLLKTGILKKDSAQKTGSSPSNDNRDRNESSSKISKNEITNDSCDTDSIEQKDFFSKENVERKSMKSRTHLGLCPSIKKTITFIESPNSGDLDRPFRNHSFKRIKTFLQTKANVFDKNSYSYVDSEEDFTELENNITSPKYSENSLHLTSGANDSKNDLDCVGNYIQIRVGDILESIIANYTNDKDGLIKGFYDDHIKVLQQGYISSPENKFKRTNKAKEVILRSKSLKPSKANYYDKLLEEEEIDYNQIDDPLNNSYCFKFMNTPKKLVNKEDPRYKKAHQIYSQKRINQTLYISHNEKPTRFSKFFGQENTIVKPDSEVFISFKEYKSYLIGKKNQFFSGIINEEMQESQKRIKFQKIVKMFKTMYASHLLNEIIPESNLNYSPPLKYFHNRFQITIEIMQHLNRTYYSNIYDLIAASINNFRLKRRSVSNENAFGNAKIDFALLNNKNKLLKTKILAKAKESLAKSHCFLREGMLRESGYLFEKMKLEEKRRMTRGLTICPSKINSNLFSDGINEVSSTLSSDSINSISPYEDTVKKSDDGFVFLHAFNKKQDAEGTPFIRPRKNENICKTNLYLF